jgi:hypothetical protein
VYLGIVRHLAFPLLALALAAAPAGAQVVMRPGRGAPPALAAATRAQQAFEQARRFRLPAYRGVESSRCEERIGRLCYWNNNTDPKLPPERPEIGRRRDELLATLARAAAAAPADDWVAGQRVRYLIEARRLAAADSVAAACSGARWWCDALRGLARHVRNDHAGAAAAFDSALAGMREEDRCRWTDLRLWLDDDARSAYRRLGCGPERDAWERRFWTASRPLLMLPADDLRNEFLARRVMGVVHAEAESPQALPWDDDIAESELRYGWPTEWGARPSANVLAGPTTPDVVGVEPRPSFDFVPTRAAMERPEQASAEAWDLEDARARTRYAPRYARRGFVELPHQLARFRRGDSTVVVGAWDVDRVPRWDSAAPPDSLRRRLDVGLVLVDGGGARTATVRPGLPRRGALVATVGTVPRLASLEVLDTIAGRAARARYAVAPLPATAPVSDLLLLERGAGPAAELDSVLPLANGSAVIRAGGVVGLYWESYLPTSPESPLTVSVRATRLESGWLDRARNAVGLGVEATPVAVRFVDLGRPDGRPGRSMTLTWPSVPPGQYRLELTVGGSGSLDGGTVAQTVRVVR